MMYKIKYSYPNSRSLTIIKDTIQEVCEALPKNGVWTLEETFDKPKIIAWQPLLDGYECHSKKLEKNSKGETE